MINPFNVGDQVMYVGPVLEHANPGDCGEVLAVILASSTINVSCPETGVNCTYHCDMPCLAVEVFGGRVIAIFKCFIPLHGDLSPYQQDAKEIEECTA